MAHVTADKVIRPAEQCCDTRQTPTQHYYSDTTGPPNPKPLAVRYEGVQHMTVLSEIEAAEPVRFPMKLVFRTIFIQWLKGLTIRAYSRVRPETTDGCWMPTSR